MVLVLDLSSYSDDSFIYFEICKDLAVDVASILSRFTFKILQFMNLTLDIKLNDNIP